MNIGDTLDVEHQIYHPKESCSSLSKKTSSYRVSFLMINYMVHVSFLSWAGLTWHDLNSGEDLSRISARIKEKTYYIVVQLYTVT